MDKQQLIEQTATSVAAAIARSGESLSYVSEHSGIPRTTLGRKLNGVTDFYLWEILAIADAIRVEPENLLTQASPSVRRLAA